MAFISGPIETRVNKVGKNDIRTGNSLVTRSVVIHWRISSKLNITQYTVTVRPPASPCSGGGGQCVVGEGDIGFSSRDMSLQLQLGVAYEVTVSTLNCGTQAGRESDPVTILLQCKCTHKIPSMCSDRDFFVQQFSTRQLLYIA